MNFSIRTIYNVWTKADLLAPSQLADQKRCTKYKPWSRTHLTFLYSLFKNYIYFLFFWNSLISTFIRLHDRLLSMKVYHKSDRLNRMLVKNKRLQIPGNSFLRQKINLFLFIILGGKEAKAYITVFLTKVQ